MPWTQLMSQDQETPSGYWISVQLSADKHALLWHPSCPRVGVAAFKPCVQWVYGGGLVRHRFAILSVALVAALISPPLATSAQEVGITTSPDTSAARTAKLAFSKNGRLLHEIRSVSATSSDDFEHVRAITYDAATGATIHSLNLGPHTDFLSATSDGQTAIISVDRNREGVRAHLLLVDVETGEGRGPPIEMV